MKKNRKAVRCSTLTGQKSDEEEKKDSHSSIKIFYVCFWVALLEKRWEGIENDAVRGKVSVRNEKAEMKRSDGPTKSSRQMMLKHNVFNNSRQRRQKQTKWHDVNSAKCHTNKISGFQKQNRSWGRKKKIPQTYKSKPYHKTSPDQPCSDLNYIE